MNLIKRLGALAAVLVLAGCAHPISIAPDVAKLAPSESGRRIEARVAYHIPDSLQEKDVITAGGGGDKVQYKPYKDMEAAFYVMLGNVFAQVTKTKAVPPAASENVSYVITPEILTASSSESLLTWPPTRFQTQLTCVVTDAAGNPVTTVSVMGEGLAEFDEFKTNFNLAAQRSTESALLKMRDALLADATLKK
ncbi:hypothetical protein [Pigmentiphaga kullae]|uniref:Lipoprotein n=1 Tax=Pigmentiphaga kullae TaxID=151784 RepID=A0A4Q7NM71_9BURK|nr:hypothetical protein [Pigmentiphaga kullae]RZS85650.1 hypothetical protein EV675_1680 [Pigmentiphaga kullae]